MWARVDASHSASSARAGRNGICLTQRERIGKTGHENCRSGCVESDSLPFDPGRIIRKIRIPDKCKCSLWGSFVLSFY